MIELQGKFNKCKIFTDEVDSSTIGQSIDMCNQTESKDDIVLNSIDSYLYGLFLTDGHISEYTRNRGRISVELSYMDHELLEKIHKIYPESKLHIRERSTNFKKDYKGISINFHMKEFRDRFISYGLPLKDKSIVGDVPIVTYSERDFWRGVIDGDGSVCITASGFPVISLVIVGEALKNSYCSMLKNNFNIEKNVHRNKRDNIYNICVPYKNAIILGDYLYKDAELYLDRKYNKYLEFQNTKYGNNGGI